MHIPGLLVSATTYLRTAHPSCHYLHQHLTQRQPSHRHHRDKTLRTDIVRKQKQNKTKQNKNKGNPLLLLNKTVVSWFHRGRFKFYSQQARVKKLIHLWHRSTCTNKKKKVTHDMHTGDEMKSKKTWLDFSPMEKQSTSVDWLAVFSSTHTDTGNAG